MSVLSLFWVVYVKLSFSSSLQRTEFFLNVQVPRVRLCSQRPQEALGGPAFRRPRPESGPDEEDREAPVGHPAPGVGCQGHSVPGLLQVRHQVSSFV